ncbi:MAG: preprotein translocase subunit YajC [Thermotogae bacterium]|nr:preprotein translocase subunit YajC [Thermotogota bacterium]
MLNVLLSQQSAGGMGDLLSLALPFVIMIAAFYFFIIMPQRREEKRRKQLIESLKKGDRVITESGIVGTVVEVKDNAVVLEISPGVRVVFLKWAIRGLEEEVRGDGKKG